MYLIRHGQISVDADEQSTLADVGRKQSSALGQGWEAAGFMPTDAMVGSGEQHAQTAIEVIDACGGPDGYDVDAGWNGDDDADAPSPERVLAAFAQAVEVAKSGRQVAVFTSAGPIAQVASQLLTGDDSLRQRLAEVVIHASVTTVLVDSQDPRLLTFNEHTHLPADLVTYQ